MAGDLAEAPGGSKLSAGHVGCGTSETAIRGMRGSQNDLIEEEKQGIAQNGNLE
jgi:hypothetical protein